MLKPYAAGLTARARAANKPAFCTDRTAHRE